MAIPIPPPPAMPPPSVHHRERGLERLRTLTVACAAGATALLGVFAFLAATSIPGHSDGTAQAATGNDQADGGASSSTGFGGTTQFQPRHDHSLSPGGGSAPVAVSGGSR